MQNVLKKFQEAKVDVRSIDVPFKELALMYLADYQDRLREPENYVNEYLRTALKMKKYHAELLAAKLRDAEAGQ